MGSPKRTLQGGRLLFRPKNFTLASSLTPYFKSSKSISALSPEMRRWSSGVENIRIHSGLMIERNPLMRAAVWFLI